jgi:amino acid efflux transporter
MNWFGIKVSGGVQLAIAGAIALLLAVAVVVALPHADLARLTPFAPHGWGSVGTAAAMLVWAFAGWEILSSLSADYRDPARDIRRATVIALVVVTVLYLGIAFATVAALGSTSGAAPLADLLVLGFGEPARPVTAVVAVLLTIGAINAYFAGGSRLGASLAREGGLPYVLADPASSIPRRSLLAICAVALGTLAVTWVAGASTDAALLMASGTFSLLYVVGAAAALRLLPRGGRSWWAAVCSLVAALILLGLTGAHLLGPVLCGGAGLVWSLTRSRRDRSRPAREGAEELEPVGQALCPDGSVA